MKSGEIPIAKLAFNYPRAESKQGFFEPEKLSEALPASIMNADLAVFKETMLKEQIGDEFWRLALVLGLFFLLAEFALIVWFK